MKRKTEDRKTKRPVKLKDSNLLSYEVSTLRVS